MSERTPLSDEERDALRERQEAGDESSICGFYEGCFVGCMADPADNEVILDTWGCGEGSTVRLSPDAARREAQALMAAADHAEFGDGEWRDGEWHRAPVRKD